VNLDLAVAKHPGSGIVLDMSAVTFMDCAGLRPLIEARLRLGGRLILRGLQPKVARLLDFVDLSSTFRLDDGSTHLLPAKPSGRPDGALIQKHDSNVARADASPSVRWTWPTWMIIGERVRSAPTARRALSAQNSPTSRLPHPRRWRPSCLSEQARTPPPAALPYSPAIRSADGLTSFVGLLSLEGTLIAMNMMGPGTAAHLNVNKTLGCPFWTASWWTRNPSAQRRLRGALTRAVAGQLVRYEETLRVSSGRWVTFDFTAVPLTARGTVTGLVFSAIDIGTRHPAHQSAATTPAATRRSGSPGMSVGQPGVS
jgi:Anti-anti-sigma regulatory factor (antagonist of anti-sigma factor)